jgi:hypothetical protein
MLLPPRQPLEAFPQTALRIEIKERDGLAL